MSVNFLALRGHRRRHDKIDPRDSLKMVIQPYSFLNKEGTQKIDSNLISILQE